MKNELYNVLDADPSDTIDKIKKSYRKKIKKFHPDHGGDPQEFTRIKKAYDVLSDPEKRIKYDKGEPIAEDQNKIDYHVNILLTQYFQQYILDNYIVLKIQKDLKDLCQIGQKKVTQLESSIKMYTSQLDNVYRKDEFENIYHSVIHQKLNEFKFELSDIQYRIQVISLAIKELDNYYEKKPSTKSKNDQNNKHIHPIFDLNIS